MLFYTYTVYTYFIFKVISALHWISITGTLDTEIEVNYYVSPLYPMRKKPKTTVTFFTCKYMLFGCFIFIYCSGLMKMFSLNSVRDAVTEYKDCREGKSSRNLLLSHQILLMADQAQEPHFFVRILVLFHRIINWSRKLDTFLFLIARGSCSCDEKVNVVYLIYIHSQFCKIFLFYVSFIETCRHSKRDFLMPVPSSFHLCPPTSMRPQPTSAGWVLGKHKRLGGRVWGAPAGRVTRVFHDSRATRVFRPL